VCAHVAIIFLCIAGVSGISIAAYYFCQWRATRRGDYKQLSGGETAASTAAPTPQQTNTKV
jgi:hypothetical protein